MASTVLDELLDWAYSQAVGFLGAFFALMENMGVELLDLPWVQAVVRFFSQLGWALFGVSLVMACFEFASNTPQAGGTSATPPSTASKVFWR